MFGKICTVKICTVSAVSNFPISFFLRKRQNEIDPELVNAWPWVTLDQVGELPDLKLELTDELVSSSYVVNIDFDPVLVSYKNKKVLVLFEMKAGSLFLVGTPITPVVVNVVPSLSASVRNLTAYSMNFAIKQAYQPAVLAV